MDRSERPGAGAWVGALLDGRYEVTRHLAEGGMGVVYGGVDRHTGRPVAVKRLHAHLADDPGVVARFRREGRATTDLGHPHIVEVIDTGTAQDGTPFLVLELLEGRSLGHLLAEEGPLPVARTVRIAGQIAGAVQVAHEHGIVHRDLKPENVFLTTRAGEDDFVKVLDFGISKIRDALDPGGPHTRTGTALGTPAYMAPEQAQGLKDIDGRADVYALGVILFRMLTGAHPFEDDSYPMLVLKICTETAPKISTWRADVPAELVALAARMLAKRPGERPPSMAAVQRELEAFRTFDGAPQLTSAPPPSRSAPRVLGATPSTEDPYAATVPGPHAGGTPAGEELDDEGPAAGLPPRRRRPWQALGLGVLGVLTAAVVLLAVRAPSRPTRLPDEIPLPDPRPPVVRSVEPRGESGGWGWLNPRPRAMPTWFAVATGGRGMVAMVGQDGVAARFLGGRLVRWDSGTEEPLRAVAWTSAEDVLAAGDEGTLVRLTPRAPASIPTGTHANLRALLVVSGTETLVAGDGGTMLRLAGNAASPLSTGTDAALLALHARGGTVWIAGERGTLLRLDGDALTSEASGVRSTLRAVGGCANGDLYAAGDQGVLLRRLPEGTWSPVRTSVPTDEAFTAITCDRGRAALSGTLGTVLLASGSRSVTLPSGFERAWHGVSGGRDEATWLVGAGGRIASIEGDHVQTGTSGPTVPLRDIEMIGGALVAVGEWGRIVRERERGFDESPSPTDAGLARLARIDDSRLVAVGDLGTVLEVRWDGARVVSTPTDASLRGVVADADGQVLAVGTGGTLLRGHLDALAVSRVPDAGDLWSVTGTPFDALAVGEGSTVVHVTRTGASRWPCDAGVGLHDVMRVGDSALAVGERGVIVRVTEGGCTQEHAGGPSLASIAPGPDGRPMAVGDDSVGWVRHDDGRWHALDLDLATHHARRIRRLGRHVYVVGTGGTILRHVLVDGT